MQALPVRSKRKESVSSENSWSVLRLWSYSKASKGICPRKQQMRNSSPLSPWSSFPKPLCHSQWLVTRPDRFSLSLRSLSKQKEVLNNWKSIELVISHLFLEEMQPFYVFWLRTFPQQLHRVVHCNLGKPDYWCETSCAFLKKSSVELSVKQTFQSGKATHTPQDTSWAEVFRKCKWCGWFFFFMEW